VVYYFEYLIDDKAYRFVLLSYATELTRLVLVLALVYVLISLTSLFEGGLQALNACSQ